MNHRAGGEGNISAKSDVGESIWQFTCTHSIAISNPKVKISVTGTSRSHMRQHNKVCSSECARVDSGPTLRLSRRVSVRGSETNAQLEKQCDKRLNTTCLGNNVVAASQRRSVHTKGTERATCSTAVNRPTIWPHSNVCEAET